MRLGVVLAAALALASPLSCGMPALDSGRQRVAMNGSARVRPGHGSDRTRKRRQARERAARRS